MAEKIIRRIKKNYPDLLIILFLLIVSSLIIFHNLGKSSVIDWDEAIYAENALQILKTDSWIVMRYAGFPDLGNLKPPLGAWLIALSFKVFGINAFALRFWSAMAGVGSIIMVYLFGKEISDRIGGIISALVLLTITSFIGVSWIYDHGARTGDYDSLLTFFVLVSLYLFYLYDSKEKRVFLIWTSITLSFAILLKGFAGIIPIVIILIFSLSNKSLNKIFNKKGLYALLTFIIITLPWFILRFFKVRGIEFFTKMFLYDGFSRVVKAVEGHEHEFGYYFIKLFYSFNLLFFIILIASVLYGIYLIRKNKAMSLLIIWVSVYLILLTLMQTKIKWYMLPIYPATTLLMGIFLEDFRKYFKINKIIFLVIFFLLVSMPFLSVIKGTNEIYIDEKQKMLENFKGDLREANNVYINSNQIGNRGVFFVLDSYIKGQAFYYDNIKDLDLKEKDYILIFNENELALMENNKDYVPVNPEKGNILYKRNG